MFMYIHLQTREVLIFIILTNQRSERHKQDSIDDHLNACCSGKTLDGYVARYDKCHVHRTHTFGYP